LLVHLSNQDLLVKNIFPILVRYLGYINIYSTSKNLIVQKLKPTCSEFCFNLIV